MNMTRYIFGMLNVEIATSNNSKNELTQNQPVSNARNINISTKSVKNEKKRKNQEIEGKRTRSRAKEHIQTSQEECHCQIS